MIFRRCFILTLVVLCCGIPGRADILELKNGTILNGKYVGGTPGTLRFETNEGMQVIQTAEIIAMTFTSPVGAAASSPPTETNPQPPESSPATTAPVAPPPPPSVPRKITLPTGTMLLVRMMDSVSSKNKAGTTFATKLEYDLVVDETVALKGGTKIYGKVKSSTQARRAVGRSTLDIRLVQVILDGKPTPITTSGFKAAGEASIKKAAKGALAGAAIGGIADGDDGARKGAAIGATMGALSKGQTITVPPGAMLEFNLAQPLELMIDG
ncbi:hypothetical protein ACFL6U_26295 [Planctomycetota bacterium]